MVSSTFYEQLSYRCRLCRLFWPVYVVNESRRKVLLIHGRDIAGSRRVYNAAANNILAYDGRRFTLLPSVSLLAPVRSASLPTCPRDVIVPLMLPLFEADPPGSQNTMSLCRILDVFTFSLPGG